MLIGYTLAFPRDQIASFKAQEVELMEAGFDKVSKIRILLWRCEIKLKES